jgi:hypothetical protein
MVFLCLVSFFGIGLLYNWPVAFIAGLITGLPLGIGLFLLDRHLATNQNHSDSKARNVVIFAPLIGIAILGIARFWGGGLPFFIGGAATTMMLVESVRQVLFGELQ